MEPNPQHGQDDPYDVDVETAASLLGVGKTRLSQLTSNGVLTFQRRKIGARNRLFYRKNELVDYLERHYPTLASFQRLEIHSPEHESAPQIAKHPLSAKPMPQKVQVPFKPSAISLLETRSRNGHLESISTLICSLNESLLVLQNRMSAMERQLHSLTLGQRNRQKHDAAQAMLHSETSLAKSTPAETPKTRVSPRTPTSTQPANPGISRREVHLKAKQNAKKRTPARPQTSTLPEAPRRARKRKEFS